MTLSFAHIAARLEKPIVTKHTHEFQEVCEALEPIYGKVIWTLPHMTGVTEYKIKEAAGIAQKRGIRSFGYLLGIIKRMPY